MNAAIDKSFVQPGVTLDFFGLMEEFILDRRRSSNQLAVNPGTNTNVIVSVLRAFSAGLIPRFTESFLGTVTCLDFCNNNQTGAGHNESIAHTFYSPLCFRF